MLITDGATVRLKQAEQIANSTYVYVNGGTLDLNGHSETVGQLFSDGTGRVTLGSVPGTLLTVGLPNPGAPVFSGSITGNGNVTVNNDSQWYLDGGIANSYFGTTTVNSGGMLILAKAGVTAVPGNLIIASGGTVRLKQAEQIANTASVTVDGTLNLNGRGETFDGLRGGGSVTTGNVADTVLTVGADNGSSTFSGSITGPASRSLTKVGSGTLHPVGFNLRSSPRSTPGPCASMAPSAAT